MYTYTNICIIVILMWIFLYEQIRTLYIPTQTYLAASKSLDDSAGTRELVHQHPTYMPLISAIRTLARVYMQSEQFVLHQV